MKNVHMKIVLLSKNGNDKYDVSKVKKNLEKNKTINCSLLNCKNLAYLKGSLGKI